MVLHIYDNFVFQCLKESLVKALGTGIGFEVGRLNFYLKKDVSEMDLVSNTSVEIDGSVVQDWTFHETMIEDHCVAVAIKSNSLVS